MILLEHCGFIAGHFFFFMFSIKHLCLDGIIRILGFCSSKCTTRIANTYFPKPHYFIQPKMLISIYFQLYIFISVLKLQTQVWMHPIPSLRMCRTLLFGHKDIFFLVTFVLFHLTGKCLGCRSSGIEHARSKYFMVNVCCMVRLYIFLFNNVHDQ